MGIYNEDRLHKLINLYEMEGTGNMDMAALAHDFCLIAVRGGTFSTGEELAERVNVTFNIVTVTDAFRALKAAAVESVQ